MKKKKEIEVTGTPLEEEKKCSGCHKVSKLDISFPNEDMNKVVDKINEIIENYGSL